LTTAAQDWSKLELWVLGHGDAQGLFCAANASTPSVLSVQAEKASGVAGAQLSLKRLG
jgi:hypothetical protein